MRTFILILITASMFQLQAQEAVESNSEYSSKQSIGLSLEYDINLALLISGEYHYRFADRWTAYAGIISNTTGSYGARVGINYNILEYKNFSIHSGLSVFGYQYNDLKYNDRDLTDWPILWELEIPVLFDVSLSDKFSIHAGLSMRLPLNDPININGYNPLYEGFIGRLKIGTRYKF